VLGQLSIGARAAVGVELQQKSARKQNGIRVRWDFLLESISVLGIKFRFACSAV
jgi:hypothetical protein